MTLPVHLSDRHQSAYYLFRFSPHPSESRIKCQLYRSGNGVSERFLKKKKKKATCPRAPSQYTVDSEFKLRAVDLKECSLQTTSCGLDRVGKLGEQGKLGGGRGVTEVSSEFHIWAPSGIGWPNVILTFFCSQHEAFERIALNHV